MAKISVIVPIYNVSKHLNRCLESIINQTFKDLEIVLVNDGSTDNSLDIIKEYEQKDKRIKVIDKSNGGLSDARNEGLKIANAPYIAFVDSDDYIELDMYEVMYQKIIKEKADIVECDFYWEYPNKLIVDKTRLNKNTIESIRVVAWNKLYKKELITKNHVLFPLGLRYEDIAFCYQLLPYVKKIVSVSKPFYHYIQRSNSISNNQNEKVRDIYKVLDIVINYYKNNNLFEKNHEQLEYVYMRYIFGSSFLRVIKVKDKKLRNSILKEGYQLLNKNFPMWKKNRYLKTTTSFKNLYFKTINKITYYIYANIFRVLKRKL